MPVPELSLTEEQIVRLFASGRSTHQIAAAVGLDERTVNWHLCRAAQKLERLSALHRHVNERRGGGGKEELCPDD
jgi:DNA-binding NarL/FixJ family response regulator